MFFFTPDPAYHLSQKILHHFFQKKKKNNQNPHKNTKMNVKTDSKITKNTKEAQTEEMEQNIHKTKQTKKKFSLVCVVQVLLCMGPVLKCS